VESSHRPNDAEVAELVSHVLALRMDYVQQLLASVGIAYSGLRKGELRDRVAGAIADGVLSVASVVAFLDRVEPGGKQHVFLLRPRTALNTSWRNASTLRRRLAQLADTKTLLAAPLPLLMPEELELSSIAVADGAVEIVGVEARRYTERDETYDRSTTTEEGLPVELRAFVERVARSTVVLRWSTATRHAALHITQATGRGIERDHYRNVASRFAAAVSSFLDFDKFSDVDLHKVIHELGQREQANSHVLTRSRRGRWDTVNGAELVATSASTGASMYSDNKLAAAIGQVADANTGQAGNLYWLPGGTGNPLSEPLHLTLVASDSRVHFMVPSTPDTVEYVIGQIRRLL
jgi:hypothetical protein